MATQLAVALAVTSLVLASQDTCCVLEALLSISCAAYDQLLLHDPTQVSNWTQDILLQMASPWQQQGYGSHYLLKLLCKDIALTSLCMAPLASPM